MLELFHQTLGGQFGELYLLFRVHDLVLDLFEEDLIIEGDFLVDRVVRFGLLATGPLADRGLERGHEYLLVTLIGHELLFELKERPDDRFLLIFG